MKSYAKTSSSRIFLAGQCLLRRSSTSVSAVGSWSVSSPMFCLTVDDVVRI